MKRNPLPPFQSRIPWVDARSARRSGYGPAAPTPAPEPGRITPTAPEHLVVTNGAPGNGESLLGVAGWLAVRAGASIRVAHLHTQPPVGDLEDVRRLSPLHPGVSAALDCEGLIRTARELGVRTGLPVRSELLTGPADPTLADYVRAHHFDLVTAAAGGPWLSLWRGGTWYELARRRPVLVVGPGVDPAWATRPRPCGDVLVLLDGSSGAEEALAPATALCRLIDARLTLLRVIPPSGAGEPAKQYRRYLVDIGQRVRRHCPAVRTVVTTGWPSDAVLRIQRMTGAIVAVAAPAGPRMAAWTPGRLAVRVLRGSAAPVLFYRPTL